MKAIFLGYEYIVVDDYGNGLILEPVEGDEDQRIAVDYGEQSLIVDPTCGELDAAKAWRDSMPRRAQLQLDWPAWRLSWSAYGEQLGLDLSP